MARYQDLADELRAAIERGDYAPGETLPKQEEIADRAGVNIKTVRAAINVLQSEGLVTPVRRRGTVVRERPVLRRRGVERYDKRLWAVDGVPAFAADREVSGKAWAAGNQTQTVTTLPADREAAEGLGTEVGEPLLRRSRRVVDADGRATHTLTSYYRLSDVEGTALADATPGPAGGAGGGLKVLSDRGLEPLRITERLHARMPTSVEVDELEMPAGEPVVILTRTIWTESRAVEFARGVHRASMFEWEYTFDVPDTREAGASDQADGARPQ